MDEFNLSPFLTDFTTPRAVDMAEVSVFGNDTKQYIAGLEDGSLSASGVFDGSTDAIDDLLDTSIQTDSGQIITYAPHGMIAVGDRVKMLSAKTSTYEVSGSMTDAVRLSYDAQADGGIDGGHLFHELIAETAIADYASVDNGAAVPTTEFGGVAHIHVLAFSGFTDVDLTVQDSADDAAFADIINFTQVTAVGAERIAITTQVRRYVRATIESVGGAGSITFAISFARRGTA